jgi:hypothetical protein
MILEKNCSIKNMIIARFFSLFDNEISQSISICLRIFEPPVTTNHSS